MGKGGGGGGGSPKLDYTDLWGVKSGLQSLTNYANEQIPVGDSAGNWAFNLASGGNILQPNNLPYTPYFAGAPTTYPSFGGAGTTGMTEPIATGGSNGSSTGLPSNPWEGRTAGHYGDTSSWYNWVNQNLGKTVNIGGQTFTVSNDQATMRAMSQAQAQQDQNTQQLGPFLSNAWQNAMPNEQGLQSETSSLFSSIGNDPANIQNVLNNTGLNPQQQAYVTQATQSGQAAIQQQLASEGLTGSTSNVMLQNEQAQAGAATAGQLIQGNEQLGLEGQQLTQQAQQLGLNTEEAQFAQQASIFSQSAGLQNQLFNQGLEGYQLSNQMINTSLAGYNQTLSTIQADNQDRLATAQLEAQVSAQENQASASGFSSLLGGLGTLFGSSSSTGGLIGSIGGAVGGLFGSGGALAGAGGAIASAFSI